ncbi:unnamed protein product [Rangifer tarandus platyrhynchus]|uniref:Uncharacterized protein n=1 Tax=Rangifer tarandus platyrhynchus TaxID=3082113 RepID=A0ABN8YLK4_RANTA|nr:unnamed protein product [Rangifer tarandus platyrhynchus]
MRLLCVPACLCSSREAAGGRAPAGRGTRVPPAAGEEGCARDGEGALCCLRSSSKGPVRPSAVSRKLRERASRIEVERRTLGKAVPSQRKSTEPGFSLPDLNRTSEAVGGESSPRQKRLLQLIHRSSITAEEVGVRSQGTEESQAGLGSAHSLRDAARSVTAQLRPRSSLALEQACCHQPCFLGPSRGC